MSDNRFSPSSADKANPYASTNPWGSATQPAPPPQTPVSSPPPADLTVPNTGQTAQPSGNPYASPQPPHFAQESAPSATSWPAQPGPGGAWAPYGEPQPQKPKKRLGLPTVVGVTCLFLRISLAGNDNSELRDQVATLESENATLSNDLFDRDTQLEELRERVWILESQSDAGAQGPAPSVGVGPAATEGFPGEGVFIVGL